ncbi:MAG TPA: lysylphosphatidylglycerol synthase transmembrane domain-containing protein, partial [Acidimicrobiales bacterium]
ELLASTAAVVGSERAVAAAVRVAGTPAVARALPVLQPQALSGWTHDALGGRAQLDKVLEQLRDTGARAVGIDPPRLRPIYRVHPRSIVLAVAALLGVATLLSQIGDPGRFWHTISGANWGYFALACVVGLLTDATFGITFLGNVPIRLPIWASIELQSAMSFSNLAIPVAADAALQIRFLQKNGMDLSSAVAAGGLLSAITEMVVQVGLLLVALSLTPDSLNFGHIDAAQIELTIAIVVFAVLILIAAALGFRRLRSVVVPPVKRAGRTVWAAVRTPARLALLIGGNVAAQCLYALSLLVCLWAFGASANFWTLIAMNIGVSLIASLVPIPGGGTAVSVVGMGATLSAVGVPDAAASATVLAQQVAVTFLPAIPGWFAMRDLARKKML